MKIECFLKCTKQKILCILTIGNMALQKKENQNVISYAMHSKQCDNDFKKKFNKRQGLLINCEECGKDVVRVNTNATKVQHYKHFMEEIGIFKGKDKELIRDKFKKIQILFNELFESEFADKPKNKWNAKVYDHFYPDYYKQITEDKKLLQVILTLKFFFAQPDKTMQRIQRVTEVS